jgi:hypothetical protein
MRDRLGRHSLLAEDHVPLKVVVAGGVIAMAIHQFKPNCYRAGRHPEMHRESGASSCPTHSLLVHQSGILNSAWIGWIGTVLG